MPTPPPLAAIDQQLAQRAMQLDREVSAARARAVSRGGGEVTDRKEEADDRMRAEVLDQEIERDLAELREVRSARERIAHGTYGLCVACGGPIAAERLLAQPHATRCLACQAEAERTSQARR